MINCSSHFNTIFLGSLKPIFDKEWQEKGWGGKDDPAKYVGFDEIVMGFMEVAEVVLQLAIDFCDFFNKRYQKEGLDSLRFALDWLEDMKKKSTSS